MVDLHVDPEFDDAERRNQLYRGAVIVYTHVPEIAAFAEFTRALVTEALAPYAPTTVHRERTPEELAEVLIDFKPRFIHHPESIAHVRRVATVLGATPQQLYADVPKLRTAFPQGGLSTGIAYAFQPHRDTWYGAPAQQVNWWMPVWPAAPDNAMEFFPQGFGAEVPNTSDEYNYYLANVWRSRIKDFSGGRDQRVHPSPRTPPRADDPRLCVLPPMGGIMLFSGDQLHATIPNTSGVTRYSIDFRTVDVADVASGRGAPRIDARCVGTSLRDFHRITDGAALDEELIAPYDEPDADGVRVFAPG